MFEQAVIQSDGLPTASSFDMGRHNSPAIVFATGPGGRTIDQDLFGGNPFATALIQVTSEGPISLRQFPRRLKALTIAASNRQQIPEWMNWPGQQGWSFRLSPGSRKESRCALVLIVSDYAAAGLRSLEGAANDERRISAMLAANGFSVTQGVAPSRAALLAALATFGPLTRTHDAAVIYCTGHGVESTGGVHLLPGDYPDPRDCSPSRLRTKALSVARMATACRASKINLVFFAGCRELASLE